MNRSRLSFLSALAACGCFASWAVPGAVAVISPQAATHPLQVRDIQAATAKRDNHALAQASMVGDISDRTLQLDLPLVIAQAIPIAGLLTLVSNAGRPVTIGGKPANKGNEMRTRSDLLKVPAKSSAHIGFYADRRKMPIPKLLVQAGKADGDTEYWFPCTLKGGQFLIGWKARNQSEKCELETPKSGNSKKSQTKSIYQTKSTDDGSPASTVITFTN